MFNIAADGYIPVPGTPRTNPKSFSWGGWSYGAEHELADIPLDTPLPKGYGRDRKDITIVNSNGVANDPTGRYYNFGGEINTPPTASPAGQAFCLKELKRIYPMAKVNHRSNLHIHVRVPGLVNDLKALKKVQRYIHDNMPKALPIIEPLLRPKPDDYPNAEEFEGALRRWRRRRVSHQTLLTEKRLAIQLRAKTIAEFFCREVPQSKEGKPQWQCQPRLCVNLRQLLETDTVEFRHFPGTLDEVELTNCLLWCGKFMQHALQGWYIEPLLAWAKQKKFPSFPKYVHWREVRYRATVHDGTVPKEQIVANIKAIEAGKFKS